MLLCTFIFMYPNASADACSAYIINNGGSVYTPQQITTRLKELGAHLWPWSFFPYYEAGFNSPKIWVIVPDKTPQAQTGPHTLADAFG